MFGDEPTCITWTSFTLIFQRCSIISSTEWDTAPMRVTPTRLPFKSAGVFISGLVDDSLQPLVDDACNHHRITATQCRGNQDIARRTHHLDVISEQRADAGGAALPGDNDFGVDTVLAEQALSARQPTSRYAVRSLS